LRKQKKVSGQALADLLVSALHNDGESFEKKLNVYYIALENRHLLRFYK
jgi:hypothetical protein